MNKCWKRWIGILCCCGIMGSMPLTAYADTTDGISSVGTEAAGADYIEIETGVMSAVASAVVSAADANQSALEYAASGQASLQAQPAEGQADPVKEEAAVSDSGSLAEADAASGQGAFDIRQKVVSYALSFVGGPYRYGGNDPRTGVDCSGFTRFVLSNAAGVQMARSSGSQASQGVAVSAEQMQPGDLLFYSGSRGINHVAMYIGSGKIVHASTYKTGIKISDWNYRNPVRIVNVLG